jgi:hypothetical protein
VQLPTNHLLTCDVSSGHFGSRPGCREPTLPAHAAARRRGYPSTSPVDLTYARASPPFGQFNRPSSRVANVATGDTLHAAIAGCMGLATIAALQQILATDSAGLLIAATDADTADLATEAGVRFDAILPLGGLHDRNDALRAMVPAS